MAIDFSGMPKRQAIPDYSTPDYSAQAPDDSFLRDVGDFGISLGQGALNIPSAAAGLVDIPIAAVTGYTPVSDLTGAIGEATGFQPGQWAKDLNQYKGAESQAFEQSLQGKGFWDTAGAYLSNPSEIVNLIGTSLPLMAAGAGVGALARAGVAARGGQLSLGAASGIGEGSVMAGSQMDQLIEQGADPRVAAIASAATGVLGGAVGAYGGTIAQRMGVFNPEAMMMQGANVAGNTLLSRMGRVGAGGLIEGGEEGVQTFAETGLSNLALGKDFTDNMGQSLAQGILAGTAMGAGTNIRAADTSAVDKEIEDARVRNETAQQTTARKMRDLANTRYDDAESAFKAAQDAAGNFDQDLKDVLGLRARSAKEAAGKDDGGIISGFGAKALEEVLASNPQAFDEYKAAVEKLKRSADVKNALLTDPAIVEIFNRAEVADVKGTETEYLRAKAQKEKAQGIYDRNVSPESEQRAAEDRGATPQQAPEEAAAEVNDRVEADPEVTPEQAAAEQADMDAALDEFGVNDSEIEDVTQPADTVTKQMEDEVDTGEADGTEPAPKFTKEELSLATAIGDFIQGNTDVGVQQLTAALKRGALRQVQKNRMGAKQLGKQLFTSQGKIATTFRNKPMPADIKKFLTSMEKYKGSNIMNARARGQLRRRADFLASKYNYPPLSRYAKSRIGDFAAVDRVKTPIGNARQNARANANLDAGLNAQLQELFNALRGYANRLDTINNKFKYQTVDLKNTIPTVDFDVDTLEQVRAVESKAAANRTKEEQQFLADYYKRVGEEYDTVADATEYEHQIDRLREQMDKGRGIPSILRLVEEDLTATIAEIENLVGEKILRKAMGLTKAEQQKSREAGIAAKAGQDSKTGIRNSQVLSNYLQNGRVRTDVIPQTQIRNANEVEKARAKGGVISFAGDGTVKASFDSNGNKYADGSNNLATQVYTKLHPPAGYKGRTASSPVEALLTVLESRMNPAVQVMSKHLATLIKQSGYANKVDVVIHDGKAPGSGAAQVAMSRSKEGAVLTIYAEGQTPEAILHEAVHVATMGILDQPVTKLTPNQKAAKEDLRKLAQHVTYLVKSMPADLKAEMLDSDGRVLHIVDIIKQGKKLDLDEFLAYGLTNRQFQDFMRRTPPPKGFKAKAINLWQVFTAKMRMLLSVKNDTDMARENVFDKFLEASGSLLGEVYVAAAADGKIFNVARDEAKDVPFIVSEMAMDASPQQNATYVTRAMAIPSTLTTGQQQAQAERQAAAQELVGAKEADVGKTVTTDRGKKRFTGHSATFIDSFEKAIADTLTRALSGGKYQTWDEFATSRLDKTGQAIVDYASGDTYTAKIVGRVLANTVDKFGVPDAFRAITSSLESKYRSVINTAIVSHETLATLTESQQDILLEYLNKDMNDQAVKAELGKLMGDKTDAAVSLVENIRHVYNQAVAAGHIQPTATGKMPEPRDFIELANSGTFPFVQNATLSVFNVPKLGSRQDILGTRIPPTRVINKYGLMNTDEFWNTKQYYIMQGADGAMYAVNAAADQSVLDQYKFTTEYGRKQFKVGDKGVTNSVGGMFYRNRTVAEHNANMATQNKKMFTKGGDKARATAISGMLKWYQTAARALDGDMNTEHMLSMNAALPTNERWIFDNTVEEGGDPRLQSVPEGLNIDEGRLINALNYPRTDTKKIRRDSRVPGNWVYIPDTKEMRQQYGKLAGKTVAGPVLAAMQDYMDSSPTINNKLLNSAMAVWKRNKTAYSLPAHINNITGNVVLAYYHDIPAENLKKAFDAIVMTMTKKGQERLRNPRTAQDKAMSALVEEMNSMGITLSQAKTADYDLESDKVFQDFMEQSLEGYKGLTNFWTMFNGVADKMVDLYSNQDNVFRLAMYMTSIQDQMYAKGGMPANGEVGIDVKQKAAAEAERAFVDYNIHAPAVKALRATLLPFLAWPYRMAGILSRVAITKPWKMANTLAAIQGVNYLAYAMLGASGDEDDERALMPEWHQGSMWGITGVPQYIRLPYTDSEGNAVFYNLARVVPLADIDSVMGNGVPSLINPGGPMSIIMALANNVDPLTGKEIRSDAATGLENTASSLKYLASSYAPGVATSMFNTYDKYGVDGGKSGPLGNDPNAWVDAAKFMGLGVFQINIPEARFYDNLNDQKKLREYKALMSKVQRDALSRNVPDYDAMLEDLVSINERMMEDVYGD
jgi:hypothetical protein